MKRILLVVLAAVLVPAVRAQGWTDLSGTVLQNVCPPNNFGAGTNGMPTPVSFLDNCYTILSDWSSAVVDTKRNRLLFVGGGHSSSQDPSIYSLDLDSTHLSNTSNCSINCTTSGSAPRMARLMDPPLDSRYAKQMGGSTLDCTATAGVQRHVDAAGHFWPVARHTYGALVYLPKADKLWMWSGAAICAGFEGSPPGQQQNRYVWTADLSALDGTTADPWTGVQTANVWNSDTATIENVTAWCFLDPTVPNEAVMCFVGYGGWYVIRYNVDGSPGHPANTMENVIMGTLATNINGGPQTVVDPDRKLVFSFGGNGGPGSVGKAFVVDLASFNVTDISSSVTGCGDVMQYLTPSGVWDPTLHRIVWYVPLANYRYTVQGTAHNEIFIFDPATYTCVQQPLLGGAGPAAEAGLLGIANSEDDHGMFGHFNYVPGLHEYVLHNNSQADAYTFTLNATETRGLGSSTITCVDRDGDGYGVGPGCLGPDADDQDAGVHTSAQFLSKWSTLAAGLQHLGYNPTNIWYLATTGNDGTGVVNDPTHPFATCCGSGKANPAAGDAVLIRGGAYTQFISTPAGSVGAPVIVMAYPGELPSFSGANNTVNCNSYNVIDGILVNGANYGNGGTNCSNVSHAVIRHFDSSNNEWNLLASNSTGVSMTELIIEDSALHDNWGLGCGSAQHGTYIANHQDQTAHQAGILDYNIFVRRNLFYKNCYNGIQFNGRFSNVIVEQNMLYDNEVGGIAFLNGVQNSTVRHNLAFNNVQTGFLMFGSVTFCVVYDATQIGTGCPYNQTRNLIENNTFYSTGTDPMTGPQGSNTAFPAISVTNQSNWALASGSATIASSGTVTLTISSWSSSVTYGGADIVAYSGQFYASDSPGNLNNQPDINSTGCPICLWHLIGPTSTAFWTAAQRVRICPPQGGNPCGNPPTFTPTSMEGAVSSYSFPTLVITIDTAAGSGTFSSWQVNLATVGEMGTGNIFQNNILVPYSQGAGLGGGGYPAFRYDEAGYASRTTFTNNQFYNLYPPAGTYTDIIQTIAPSGGSYVYNYFTCAQAVSGSGSTFGSFANCAYGDPKFVAASPNYWNTPASFNLRLQDSSPARFAGVYVQLPSFDLVGTMMPVAPNEGAFQPSGCMITPGTLGPWTNTQVISQNLTEAGCNASTFTLAGSWPTGLSGCNSGAGPTCTVSGTINEPSGGTSTPSVSYDTATNNYTIVVNPAPSITTSCPLPNANQGQAYSDTLVSSGGTAPLTWAISAGSLPTGLGLGPSTGVINGTPSGFGTSSFTLQLTDANNISITKSCSLFVTPGQPQLGTVGNVNVSGQTR